VAVTSVPDPSKGERLIVFHTLPADRLNNVLAGLARSNLPNLWKPRPRDFLHVEALPYLGSGKLDLKRLRELAQTELRAESAANE
jgi:acyl-[acyl-carrier-protein]-phospholipid O-acyltransferase/long-chain-fatty-acid--[acyl-carrier-protein] ligase